MLAVVITHTPAVSDLTQSLSNHAHSSLLRRDPNTIFRGNSLTSKCIDETMKLAGMHYLQVTLKPIIDEVSPRHSKSTQVVQSRRAVL